MAEVTDSSYMVSIGEVGDVEEYAEREVEDARARRWYVSLTLRHVLLYTGALTYPSSEWYSLGTSRQRYKKDHGTLH